ncbi:acyl-CoA dehydrogenase family protein [Streptomyces sp. NPDC028635]|uniref:acyl-CoA dehydrogenase family protein n=1 Tax=Streptomyces sp. NPDC028635 TaxID=3154800 RepID=UPI0033F29E67
MSGALTPETLEELLGDPADPANPFGYAAAVAHDEANASPERLNEVLRDTGFHLNYLPERWGGTFRTFDRSLTLVRAAARRDVRIMPGTMFSIIAATCLQLHGTTEQQERVARILRDGGAVAFALTEADHGSDLLAGQVRLDPDGLLHGEKWLVGNGLRAQAVYVVARTGARGPGAFTSFLLDLTDGSVDDDDLTRLPAPPITGMRGIDLATLRFDALAVPWDAQVGKEGEGLDVAIRAQQAVRLMSMAGSLGIADTALRLTLGFTAERRFGRTALSATPYAAREVATASAALLAADAVALSAARGVHVVPEAFSVWGPAAKHLVAEATEDALRHCGTVLATRSVLREQAPGDGVFQKLQRDSAVVRVIDASPYANLRSYSGQLPTLLTTTDTPAPETLRRVFALDAELPPYEPGRLDLIARGVDPVLGGLPTVAGPARAALDDDTSDLVARLAEAVAGLPHEAEAARRPGAEPNALADLAERYAWLHGAAACVHLWWANRERPLYGGAPGATGWLRATLAYLLARADGTDPRRNGPHLLPALDVLAALRERDELFTATPVRLAATPQEAADAHA